MTHLLALGYGFSARATAARLRKEGWTVTGTSRTPGKFEEITLWSLQDALTRAAAATHLLVSVPPGETGDPILLTNSSVLLKMPKLK